MSDLIFIYIHIPFCRKKCIYCDFYSDTDTRLIPDYVTAVSKEIQMRAGSPGRAGTIYFGGGTPSLLTVSQAEFILGEIDQYFGIARGAEITFEVNPGTLDLEYLKDLKSAGINRLSIGTQSFNPDKLIFLKRIHDAGQGFRAVEQARQVGFDNLSLDLIYGLPFENDEAWGKDLSTALKIQPEHMSCYMLTVEPSTPLHRLVEKGHVRPTERETLSRLFCITSQTLENAGYEHYEISNFAKGQENRSRHNSVYWDMTPYMGFGAAAHSYDGSSRAWNHRSIKAYIKDIDSECLPVAASETLDREQQIIEMIMLGLRTSEGICLEIFKNRFGMAFEEKFAPVIDQVCKESFGRLDGSHFSLTIEGKVRLDSIVEAFAEKI